MNSVQDRLDAIVGEFADLDGREKLELLVVPQFTLAADTRKGTRASFTRAAPPERPKYTD